MTKIPPFTHIPPGALLYFHYGLAFIFLGVAIIAKDMKGSRLKIARPLHYLAVFGFIHGTHEWFELYLVFQNALMSPEQILVVKSLGAALGILSFLFLMQFGLSLMGASISSAKFRRLQILYLVVTGLWVGLILILWFRNQRFQLEFIEQVDIVTRYCFGFTGSIVTALSLFFYSHNAKRLSEITTRYLSHSGIAFFLYGLCAGLVPSKTLIPFVGAPIELARMVVAMAITFFMIKALNIFDIETREMVAEQMKQLAQSEKLASIGQLAAGVAHEINSPLTNASLNVQMVQRYFQNNSIDEKISTRLESISRNIERASTIAQELLQFSRSSEEDVAKIDLHHVVESALSTVDYRLKKIKIKTQVQENSYLIGNFGKLQQVIINTLNNAIEAINEAGEIRITTTNTEDSLVVTIADNGEGIPQKKLARLFDPFFTTKKVGSGTGLGLFICYSIIKQHGGTIDISSTVGIGTAVVFKLPLFHKTE